MGITFKENCPDTRNSKVFDVMESLTDYGLEIDWLDPWIDDHGASKIDKWNRVVDLQNDYYDTNYYFCPT